MASFQRPSSLFDTEEKIVWLENVESLPFVRESWVIKATRSRPITHKDRSRRIVGYAVLRPDSKPWDNSLGRGRFYRRFFYVKTTDAWRKDCPSEGVDPCTVRPGKPGEHPTMRKTK